MSHDVFLSYKREDEERAARLVRALESHGLSVWWDRSLPGGESWQANIESALNAAGCVVVMWSEGAVGPAGQYVRDEARRALVRGVLVPVLVDPVAPPLGFGEIQAIDLVHWRGAAGDPFVGDVVTAILAKLRGQPVPPAKAPTQRWARRFTAGGAMTAFAALLWILAADAFAIRERVCTAPLAQPDLSDLCGRWGLGGRPTRDERLAWERRTAGDCDALREHVRRFPQGAHRATAADLLTAVRVESTATTVPQSRENRGYVRQPEQGLHNEDAARADALQRARRDAADTVCAVRDDTERLQEVSVEPVAFDCRTTSRGIGCSLDYRATCTMAVTQRVERCG